jgi:transcriptional regulator with XRE-family HTH domain
MGPGGHASARRLLADNLRLMRVMRRLSQTVLAEEAGVTQALVSAIERGRANPTLDSLERLALVLGVRVDELFAEAEGRKS